MLTKTTFAITFLAAIAHAKFNPADKLDKPPLGLDFGNLKTGLLASIRSVPHSTKSWPADWIPADCKKKAEKYHLSPSDIRTYEIQYTDCVSPWIFCRHKDAPAPIANMTSLFGQVPVRARSWVRHVMAFPKGLDTHGALAYNDRSNIAFFYGSDRIITTYIHETAHSLDILGAFEQKENVTMSSSQKWINNYEQDTNVPDTYARSNMFEDVAQNSVIAAYNLNVPGGLATLNKNFNSIFHQYATIETAQRHAGNLLVAGGSCGKRLDNSKPVRVDGGSKLKSRVVGTRAEVGEMPNVDLAPELEVIEPKEFNTQDHCAHK